MPGIAGKDFAEGGVGGWGVGEGLWISPTFNLTPVFLRACSFVEKVRDTRRQMHGLQIAKV